MKRVLVTGGSGFIGSETLPLLIKSGHDVHACSSRRPPGRNEEVTWHAADLLDSQQTRALMHEVRPTHLLHLSWCGEPAEFWASTENLRWVDASLRLLELFAAAGGERAVGAGSCAEYEWGEELMSEEVTPLAPATLYGACKSSVQNIGARLAAQEGFSFAWGRMFFSYGPDEHPSRLVSSITRALVTGNEAPCSEGSQRRDFLYSEDVASAFVGLLDSAVEGPVNVASGETVSIRDLVLLIGELTGRPELLQFGALPTRPNEPAVIRADTRRLHDEVAWTPSVTLETGLRRTVDWWRSQLDV